MSKMYENNFFNTFYTFLCNQQSLKIRPKIDRFFVWSDFWLICDWFLIDFGIQNLSKINPKTINKKYNVLDCLFYSFRVDFENQIGGSLGVLEFRFERFLPLGAILGPRWPPDPSKRPPGSILDQFQMIFRLILNVFWNNSKNMSGYFWTSWLQRVVRMRLPTLQKWHLGILAGSA